VWTPINRPADSHLSRERYLQRFQPLEEEQTLRSTIVTLGASFPKWGMFPARMVDFCGFGGSFPVFFLLRIQETIGSSKNWGFQNFTQNEGTFRQPLDGVFKGDIFWQITNKFWLSNHW